MKIIKSWLCFLIVTILLLNACKPKESTSTEPAPLVLGQKYQGGIIFFLDFTGKHGFIAAPSDQSTHVKWGCNGKHIAGTSPFNGAGNANTQKLLEDCSAKGTPARLCNDLVIEGYSDWFLPSRNELNLLYQQKNFVGGFANNFYWSSTEYDKYSTWCQHFFNGCQDNNGKFDYYCVRAIRAF